MKRFNVLLSLLIVAAFAFSAQAQVELGVKAGSNFNNIRQDFKNSDFEMDTKIKPGFQLGVTADVPFYDNFSFQVGLIYSGKGYSFDMDAILENISGGDPDGASIDGYFRTTFNYIEVPLNFAFKANSFQIFAGLYVAVGLSGNQKYDYTVTYQGHSESDKGEIKMKPAYEVVNHSNEEGAFTALDYGFNAGVGYKVGPVLIQAGYSLGLGNMTPAYEGDPASERDDYKISNRVITLSVSYFFGR